MELLNSELYIVTQDQNGDWINFDKWNKISYDSFRSFSTGKLNEIIEKRSFDFWKWVIPTVISVLALVISSISMLYALYGNDIVKVILLQQ